MLFEKRIGGGVCTCFYFLGTSYFVLLFIVGLLFQKVKDVRMQVQNKDLNYVS